MAGIKLFVDDIRQPPDDTWTVARTATQAIRMLATAPAVIEEISIDHDITHGGQTCPETFEAVAYCVALMPADRKPAKVHIHTANVSQAGKLKKIFEDAGIKATANLAR